MSDEKAIDDVYEDRNQLEVIVTEAIGGERPGVIGELRSTSR